MKIYYSCECCGEHIDILEVDVVDEEGLGFDCLTEPEREDIIKIDASNNAIFVKSLCDYCIEALGVADSSKPIQGERYLH